MRGRRRRNPKFPFYAKHALACVVPNALYRRRRDQLLSSLTHEEHEAAELRAGYYNKLEAPHSLSPEAITFSELRLRPNSAYYFDLRAVIKYFPPHLRFDYMFGDVTRVPTTPRLLKSRPILCDNANSVILKLNTVRHFNFVRDDLSLEQKLDRVVWRGRATRKHHRSRVLERYSEHPMCDFGQVNFGPDEAAAPWHKEYMSIPAQLNYKFILSLEGNDVASNLKWAMSSNSACMMRKPRFETWFMEGKLQPGVHYIELADDFSDLEEKLHYHLDNMEETRQIVRNANAHVARFTNRKMELVTSLMVLRKYFDMTRQ